MKIRIATNEDGPRIGDGSMNTAMHPTPGGPVVVGLDNIGKLFGRNRRTIRRWIEHEDFPASCLPDGTWTTSYSLIDNWLLGRIEDQWET